MKAKQIQELNNNELKAKLVDLKTELFNLRFSHATGQLSNPMQMVVCKKDIARVKTIMRERELVEETKAKKAQAEPVKPVEASVKSGKGKLKIVKKEAKPKAVPAVEIVDVVEAVEAVEIAAETIPEIKAEEKVKPKVKTTPKSKVEVNAKNAGGEAKAEKVIPVKVSGAKVKSEKIPTETNKTDKE